jgi:hypothetical protein
VSSYMELHISPNSLVDIHVAEVAIGEDGILSETFVHNHVKNVWSFVAFTSLTGKSTRPRMHNRIASTPSRSEKAVAPPVALSITEPNMVFTMPVLPLVLVNAPFPLDFVVAPNGVGRLESVIPIEEVTEPQPPALPEISPKTCNFLDPWRLRRVFVLLLGEA